MEEDECDYCYEVDCECEPCELCGELPVDCWCDWNDHGEWEDGDDD
jgi:hypothetical protein